MTQAFTPRPEQETLAERAFLERRLALVEADMGRLAARSGAPTPDSPALQALGRGRALLSDLLREIRVRTLQDALAARLTWLERAQARRVDDHDPEPKPALELIALDRRLLQDLETAWRSEIA